MKRWSIFTSYRKKNYFYFQVFSVFANLLVLVLPIYSLQVFDRVLSSRSTDTLLFLALIAVFLLVVQVAMDYTRQQVLNNVSSIYDQSFGELLIQKSLNLSSKNAAAAHKAVKDHQLAKQYLSSPFHRSLSDLPWSLIFIIVLFLLHPMLGAYALAVTLVLATASGLLLLLTHKSMNEAKNMAIQQSSSVQKLFCKGKLLKSYQASGKVLERWKQKHSRTLEQELRSKCFTNYGQTIIKMIRMTVQVGVFAVGAWLVINEQIMAGSLLAASILLGRILAPIDQGANQYFNWLESKQAFERIGAVFSSHQDDSKMDIALDTIELSVDQVTYRGGGDRLLVHNIGFNLKPGHCLAIKGASGAGKSTLLKLLANYYVPTKGQVRVNGINIDKLDTTRLAESIGYLPQVIDVFDATVSDNISRFGDHLDMQVSENVVKASKAAQCHSFVAKLPQSYGTMLGSEGVELSRSEMQRLALARCFYYQPKLLILDEPTAFLDNAAVLQLMKHLEVLKSSGVGIIFVSSSPLMMTLADYVVELKDGVISEAYENKAKQEKKSINIASHSNYQAIKY
ncbi:ATP-binding cassette domain-containing protein [Vibrio sp. S9_S30]|uniref:type I secretion system permease/ATPase n=1 Tax=Vibrio sp. S9_S30 TaxID=2720226 RepID=UPI0016812B9E|nr:ATP-binding cassette domain-containing protein [Vibrio sp. S9_S30]MBD1556203.1 ATP-binding cassette domain-containing protein [Vibrio sp. S9_S30]